MELLNGLAERAETFLEKIDGQTANGIENMLSEEAEWNDEAKRLAEGIEAMPRYVPRSVAPEGGSSGSRITELKLEVQMLDNHLKEMQSQLDTAQDALGLARRAMASSEKKLKLRMTKIEKHHQGEIEELLESHDKEIEILKTESISVENSKADLLAKWKKMKSLSETLQLEKDQLKKKLLDYENRTSDNFEDMISELDNLKNELERNRIEYLEHLHESESRIAELEQSNSDLSTEVVARQKDDVTDESNNVMQADILALQVSNETLFEELQEEKTQLASAAVEKESLKLEISRVYQKIDSTERNSQSQLQELHKQLAKSNAELKVMRRVHDTKPEVSALEERLASLSEHLNSKQKSIELLTSEKRALLQRLSEQNTEMDGIESGFGRLKRRPSIADRMELFEKWTSNESVLQVLIKTDKLLVHVGSGIGNKPLPRLGFLLYFIVLHLWILFGWFFHSSHEKLSEMAIAAPDVH